MLSNTVVNILGSNYKIIYKNYSDEFDFKTMNACGLCDGVKKVITICNVKTHPEFGDADNEYATILTKEILRHELFHAFLHESGLAEDSLVVENGWAINEEMVDWFAIQSPKIYKVFKELDIL